VHLQHQRTGAGWQLCRQCLDLADRAEAQRAEEFDRRRRDISATRGSASERWGIARRSLINARQD
jgi:hypothetical protein